MSEIESQAQLEELLNNPEKFKDYVASQSKEVLGETVKEQMEQALKEVGAVGRLPMSEEAAAEATPVAGKEYGGGWSGKDETKIDLAREAKGMDGQFKSFGEFLTTMAPGTIGRSGFDARLKVLGEGQGDQGSGVKAGVQPQFTKIGDSPMDSQKHAVIPK